MMNLLVTGGAGFIGAHVIHQVVDRPGVARLVNLDALTYAADLGRLAGIHGLHPKYVFEKADVRDAAEVARVVKEHAITHVIHLAAESHVDRSIQSAGVFMETNVLGTLNLLNACREFWENGAAAGGAGGGVRGCFVQVSTDEVYGSLGAGDEPFTEESALQPNSPYAASKAAADSVVRSYVKTHGFPAVITRCCNNYGPGQHAEKFIPTVLNCLREQRPIPLYGDGQNVREWIHVSDHAEALWTVLNQGKTGEVYNIGSGEELPNLELVRRLCALADEAADACPGHHLRLLSFVADRPGHDRRYAVSTALLRRHTGWQGLLPLAEGLRGLAADAFKGLRAVCVAS